MPLRRTIRAPSKAGLTAVLVAVSTLGSWLAARAALGLALLTAAVVTAPVAHAEMILSWEAPQGCPERAEVLDRMRALVGSSIGKSDVVSVEGRIGRIGRRFSLTLLVRDGREVRQRVITSESCADLAGAAAVTLALLLGIDVSAAEPSRDGDSNTETRGTATTTDQRRQGESDEARKGESTAREERSDARDDRDRGEDERDKPTEGQRASSTRRWAVVARAPIASADLGPLPRPSLGAGIGVGLRYESWRAVLAGQVSRGQTVNAPEPNTSSGAEIERVKADLSTCRGFGTNGVELGPCIAVALEHVTARGFGEDVEPESASATWAALGAGGIAHWYPWKSLAIFASVTGYVELSRPRLVIDGLGDVAELKPVAASLGLGAEWIF